ncbi:hypothetical protein QTP70_004732 [Hemibagrus guttatus]|uniref:Tf2-1-like SH3-like domain-containing protein n=1 Tax=Hemibagrus guttatus TaxID=175788 RepID=A0AAE0V1B8_9TELE|nr:hypothetical protein QTP70_004732 [Hemibagrus guttatus]KAK3563859.1 hypothetical protein QTP86_003727 [Hemibagrus guttatus]
MLTCDYRGRSRDSDSKRTGIGAPILLTWWDKMSGCRLVTSDSNSRACKLSPKFIGPFKILCQVNPVCYCLQLPASYRICPTFHVSLLRPARLRQGDWSVDEPPPPLEIDGSPAYQHLQILRKLSQSVLNFSPKNVKVEIFLTDTGVKEV